MKVKQIYTSCLSEMTYYIQSHNEAAIIDPLRETETYLKMAEGDNATIKYIFLTHFHADFVSGHVDLAKKTGATIVYGPNAVADFKFYLAKDDEEFKIGKITIKLLHTPGHTLESSSYLLIDEKGNKPYVFTGDCLFIDDVGRPDLAVKSNLSKNDLAGLLFDSLRNKIMPLPDDIIIYPAHGAGSACGKNMSYEKQDTLKHQKKTNYALSQNMSKEEFIKEVTTGLSSPPQYFPHNVRMNKSINKKIDLIVETGTTPLNVETFKKLNEKEDIIVIDTRSKDAYIKEGTIKGAIYIGINGNFAPWVGTLIKDINQKIIFIADDKLRAKEIVTRFSRVGYDNILGYLSGEFKAWKEKNYPIDKINSVSANKFADIYNTDFKDIALDVRKKSEYTSEHVLGIDNFPLDNIFKNLIKLDSNKAYFIHCKGGYRSLIAASILQANGIKNITNIEGGFDKIKTTNLSLSKYICPISVL